MIHATRRSESKISHAFPIPAVCRSDPGVDREPGELAGALPLRQSARRSVCAHRVLKPRYATEANRRFLTRSPFPRDFLESDALWPLLRTFLWPFSCALPFLPLSSLLTQSPRKSCESCYPVARISASEMTKQRPPRLAVPCSKCGWFHRRSAEQIRAEREATVAANQAEQNRKRTCAVRRRERQNILRCFADSEPAGRLHHGSACSSSAESDRTLG